MGRALDVLEDRTPPLSPHVDVPVRVGWLVRSCRLHGRDASLSTARAFAKALGVGAPTLSKWEKGREHIGALAIERVEEVAGLPAASLRGVIHGLRRVFRQPTNNRAPAAWADDLDLASEMVAPTFGDNPQGIDWLRLADVVVDGRLMIPTFLIHPVLERLVSEYARSVGQAFLSRDEAVARLLHSAYADRLERLLIDTALADDAQVVMDVLGVTGQRPSSQLFLRMCGLLADPRPGVLEGASLALTVMVRRDGLSPDDLRELGPRLEQGVLQVPTQRRDGLGDLLASLPRGLARPLRARLGTEVASPAFVTVDPPVQAATSRRVAQDVAATLGSETEAGADPMLTRLVREALFDQYVPKRLYARYLLMATPYVDVVGGALAAAVERTSEPGVLAAVQDASTHLGTVGALGLARRWAVSGVPEQRVKGFITLAHAADRLDEGLLDTALERDWSEARFAMYAAGMTGDPSLEARAGDPASAAQVRTGARWWLREGPRITD